MTVQEILYAYLNTRTSVGDRIYPGNAPQGVVEPYILMARVSAPRTMSHSGPSKLSTPSVQFTAWAEDPDAAANLGAEIIAELEGVTIVTGGHVLKRGEVVTDRDDYDPTTELHGRLVEFEFDWEEA